MAVYPAIFIDTFGAPCTLHTPVNPDYHFYLVLSYFSTLFVVVPLGIGFARRAYFKTEEKIFFLLMLISLATEIVGFIFLKNNFKNMYIYRIYTVLEFTLLSFFFIKTIAEHRLIVVMKLLIIPFACLAGLDIWVRGFKSADSIATTTESILLILYSVSVFYFLLKTPMYMKLVSAPLFWLNTSVLIYFSGNLFVFIFSSYLESHSHKVYYELWGIHSILNVIFYGLISIGFWKTKTHYK